jgi:HlyD family secretion protein
VTAAELRQGVAVPSRLNDLHLLPGMPAEVFIQISLRSPLQYMLKPLAARQLVIF